MSKRLTIENYKELATKKGFEWLGEELPKNNQISTLWKCDKGHIWNSTHNHIQQNYGCPYCSGRAKKVEQDYHNLAKSKEFEWIGKELPKNTHTKTQWKCNKGHIFQSRYDDIQANYGCRYCFSYIRGQSTRKIEKDYYNLAQERNIKWIGKELPNNIHIKTKWRCKKGHEWMACYNKIRGGNNCPYCKMKTEQQVRMIFEQLFGCNFIKIKPQWLKNPESNKRLELDGYNEELKLAFEYDGEYHYQDHYAAKTLEKQQFRDQLKDKLCKENGITLIRIPYYIENKEEFIKNKLIEYKIIGEYNGL